MSEYTVEDFVRDLEALPEDATDEQVQVLVDKANGAGLDHEEVDDALSDAGFEEDED